MSNKSVMGLGQAHELDQAMRKNQWEPEDIKKLSEGDMLAKVRQVVRGEADIITRPSELRLSGGSPYRGGAVDTSRGEVIDCSAELKMPYDGWRIEAGDQIDSAVRSKISAADIESLADLHRVDEQAEGIVGTDLKRKLEGRPVLTAHVLEWYLEKPDVRIPEDWKRVRKIFFWGTIYRGRRGDPVVRYLCWHGDRWDWGDRYLDGWWFDDSPAVVLAGDF